MIGPRAALRVLWGPASGRRRVLGPGSTITVGRDADCDLALHHDAELSGEHFHLHWDGARGTLNDRQSRRGTLVGGEPAAADHLLRHGVWLRAGTSDFVFEIEGPAPVAPPREVPEALREAARAGRLWVLVDASRGDRVLQLLRSSMDPGRSLYEGIQGEVLVEVAPHLVHLEPDSRLLEHLVSEGWESGFALYLATDLDERALRRHLRRFLVVAAEGIGPRTYFRFYDPAVFATFWSMATVRQRAELSRGIAQWWAPRPGGDEPDGPDPLVCFAPPPPAED